VVIGEQRLAVVRAEKRCVFLRSTPSPK
jgi:hypothetical protein